MRKFPLTLMFAILLAGCAAQPVAKADAARIAIDLDNVNVDGLRGPPDGLRAVHYEFCIPADGKVRDEVRAIDPTAQFTRGAPGRVGCASAEYLAMGNTHQDGYREVLRRLAALHYVRRIQESHFE